MKLRLILLALVTLAATAQATVLTFDGPFSNYGLISQDYGDNVTNTTMGTYSYGVAGEGFTPDIDVEYIGVGGGLHFWDSGYGDLVNVVENEDDGERWTSIRFEASYGVETVLHSIDLASFSSASRLIDSISITNDTGVVLFQTNNVTLAGSGHININFGAVSGRRLTLVLDLQTVAAIDNNDDIALDNITFSQTGTALFPDAVAVDGDVPANLGVDGTESDPDIYIIGATNAYTRDYGTTPLIVGWSGSTGGSYGSDGRSHVQLYIQNGSTVISGDGSSVGQYYNKSHRLVRLTDASSWIVDGKLSVPEGGNGDRLEVFGGSLVTTTNLIVAGASYCTGTLVVSNANSRVVSTGDLGGGTATGSGSYIHMEDHGLVQVDGDAVYFDIAYFNAGFFAWAGDHTSDSQNPFGDYRVWSGTNWQDQATDPIQFTETYYATDAEAKLATADPNSGFAGYDGLGGYTIWTSYIAGEEIVTSWSGHNDFSGDSNPNGEWSYGGMDGSFSNFTPGTFDPAVLGGSWVTRGENQTGWIWTNTAAENTFGIAPGKLALHPGYDESLSSVTPTVLRWTAPAFTGTGSARLIGQFHPSDTGAVNNRVSHNSISVWDQVSGNFDLVFDVASGDTIDFIVYGVYDFGATQLDASIQLTRTEQSTNTLTVISEQGTPVPAIGVNNVTDGSTIACSVDSVTNGTTCYFPTGWTLSGQEPASGTTNWFELTSTTNATLTWNWQTNHWLDANVSGGGSVDVSDGFFAKDSEQILTATPDAGWLFMGWSGDASGTNNNASVTMDAPKTVMAVFSDDADGDGLLNSNEVAIGSNPWKSDSDNDGFDDAFEVAQGMSPIVDNSAIVNYIGNHSDTFELYPSNVVLNVAVGQMVIETSGDMATLSLQLEESGDLVTWTNAGPAEIWSWPVDGEKKYFRVRSSQ